MDEIPDVRPTLTKEDDYKWNNKQSLDLRNAQVPQQPPRQESVEEHKQSLKQQNAHVPQHPPTPESVEEGPTTTIVEPTAPPQLRRSIRERKLPSKFQDFILF